MRKHDISTTMSDNCTINSVLNKALLPKSYHLNYISKQRGLFHFKAAGAERALTIHKYATVLFSLLIILIYLRLLLTDPPVKAHNVTLQSLAPTDTFV